MIEYTNSGIAHVIDEYVHSARDRAIISDRLINGDPPAEMQAVYDYLHRKHIDKAAGVSVLRSMYKA